MTYRVPYLAVSGPDGTDFVPIWGSRLVGVKVISNLVDASDTCTFTFRNRKPYVQVPAENTPFLVEIGWSKYAASLYGVFYMHSVHLSGSPKRGEEISFECWSGDMTGLDKVNSQHFNHENGHSTLGDVFQTLFAGSGMDVAVAASIAGLPLPGGHLLQWNQSAIDFATDLANNAGGVVKPMSGKIIVLDRNGGQTVSGVPLPDVHIDHADCYEYDVQTEPRFNYKSASVTYADDGQGRLKVQIAQAADQSGAAFGLPHPAADQAAADTLGKVCLAEFRRFTATGLFVTAGKPGAFAGCKPTFTGFPDPISDQLLGLSSIQWIAAQVTHDVEVSRGWTTTIETETDPE